MCMSKLNPPLLALPIFRNGGVRTLSNVANLLGVAALVFSAVGLGGCKTDPPPARSNLTLVSQNGTELYRKARQHHAYIRVRDLQGKSLGTEMAKVLRWLDGAITNDPKCPLFHSKLAEMQVTTGQLDRAAKHFETSRQLHQDWVPAWTGLAEIALRKGQFDSAYSYLDSAAKAMEALKRGGSQPGATPGANPGGDMMAVMGLNVPGGSGNASDDPRLSLADANRMLINWLQESEAWTIENPNLLISSGAGGMAVPQGRLFRRVRARIDYQRAMVDLARGAKAGDVIAAMDKILAWDPDFFSAKVEKAVQLRKLKRYREAERLLRPYMDSKDPTLANNGRLLLEMASIYTDWYAQTHDTETADLADGFFDKLHKLNPDHATGYIKRAELYLDAGSTLKRADTLDTALSCLKKARAALGQTQSQNDTRINDLEKKIKEAKRKAS